MYIPPNYLSIFHDIFPKETVELLVAIETYFDMVNYDSHKDDIASIYNDSGSMSSKDICDHTLSLYREHINSVLSMQGVFLSNPYTEQLQVIVTILHCVTLLATVPLTELLGGDTVPIDNMADVYFATILSKLSDLNIMQALTYIDCVTDDVIEFLQEDIPLQHIVTKAAVRAEKRFKDWLAKVDIPEDCIIVNAVKSLDKFGYDVSTFILSHAEAIADLVTCDIEDQRIAGGYEDAANEIILLVLGSSTEDKQLLITMIELTVHIVDNADDQLKVNSLITKAMENYHE